MARNTWDRERFMYERDRDRFADDRSRYDDDDHYYRGGSGSRHRDSSVEDRYERRADRRPPPLDDDIVIRESRRVYYDDEPRSARHRSPPAELERDRRVVIERERDRHSSPSPPRRPSFLRRQSSLDTFDRRPKGFYEEERYGPPARREEFRPKPYEPIPLPRSRALPPPRRYAERDSYEEIRVSDPDFYGDDEFRSYPERVREKEIIRTKRRDYSPSSRSSHSRAHTRSHRGSSRRSSSKSSTITTSSTSSSGGTTVTVKSEYPKKGKTRIPARLVSKRALIDLGYPFIEEGNTIVVLKALGQENIDDMLKLSEDYKKSELEVIDARSEAGTVFEERREERREETFVHAPPPPPTFLPPPPVAQPPPPVIYAPPPPPPPAPAPAPAPAPVQPVEEYMQKRTTIIRDVSPARSYTTTTSGTTSRTPVIVDVRREEYSDDVPVGPLALVKSDRHRSRSRSNRDIRHEIRDLERQLDRKRHSERDLVRAERHSDRELVKAERLSSGELVLFEEQVERIEEPRRGVRIEKDKKGRMSISVPKYR
ncbi:hypothetical protein VP1G_06360 [Cytospora mali]|uniref:DUF8035 domain-containing protein n=1 Tax=Cytospora mali TaxID=578113 RepID=A0A194V5I8_CYTMA|nr:hypothetical protein VP1G_06360 [Valsa mali var. pyri (nom. inval.)]